VNIDEYTTVVGEFPVLCNSSTDYMSFVYNMLLFRMVKEF